MQGTMMVAVATLQVLVVATMIANAHARSTTANAFAHNNQLCSDVHGTLDSMARVLEAHDVPFFPKHHVDKIHNGSHNDTTTGHKTTRENTLLSSLVDLSPIHRMMTAFGCDDRNEDSSKDKQHLEGDHRTPPAPLLTTTTAHVEEKVNDIRRNNATTKLPFQQQSQPQHSRVRRNQDPVVHAGQCTLASVVDGSCPGPTINGSLVISVEDTESPDEETDASTLRSISPRVTRLVLNGHIEAEALEWVVTNGNWTMCRSFSAMGVQFPTLQLSVLNPMTSVDTINICDSKVLRALGTDGFALSHELVHMDLHNNSLTSVPDVSGMTSLSTLSLHNNRIRGIAKDDFKGLPVLQQLLLGENLISEIESRAFDDLTQLQVLTLFANEISTIHFDLFHRLMSLTKLQLHQNPITELDAHVFAGLPKLDHLSLEDMLLTSLPATLFRKNTRLTVLNLAGNFITSLPKTIFSGLSYLQGLQIFNNRLSSLPPGVLEDLAALKVLDLSRNELTSMPDDLLQFNRFLDEFFCANSHLTQLPPNLFANTPDLRLVSFANNDLHSIDNVLAGASLPSLVALNLNNNHLTELHLSKELPAFRRFGLSSNPMQELPDVTLAPALKTMRLQNHEIKHMDLAPLLRLSNLDILELDASPQAESKAVLTDANIGSVAPLSVLSLENVDVTSVIPLLERLPSLSLDALHVGWPGASNATLPISKVCMLLAKSVRELRIANTNYEAIELCADRTFHSILLNDNEHLRSVTVHNPLRELNMSGCTHLTSIDAPPIDILDISNTNFLPVAALCTRWGRRILFARNLAGTIDTRQAAATARNCLQRADVIDLSGNTWLGQLEEINRVTERSVVLSEEQDWTADLVPLPSRSTPPILQLTDAPIECALQLSNRDLRRQSDLFTFTPQIVFSFHCTCARGFKMTSDGRCVLDEPNIAGVAAGSVIGGLFFGLFVAWLSRHYRGLTKRIGLQEQLLVEMDEEVMALKKAWEIEYGELRLVERVAAGAFGVVFKAEWDTVMVAVKVLQQGVMMFDENTVQEFEKEVEFLQRTRHPNVVRFFGAGTDPNGSPFLVLEFVALGSLKDLLGKDMENVLREAEQGERSSEDGARQDVTTSDIVGEELTLVSTESDRRPETMTVWDLKLRLLRDVASGMAFTHSLDQMHRDLKSVNVLVSSSLRAKITDFGSIRRCFTRDRHQRQRTRLSSSRDDDGDGPEYNQQAGLQTMAGTALAAGVGTPLYMAPEALTGDKCSFEADIFSFGVLMWEVATQRTPDLIEQEKGSDFRGPLLTAIAKLLTEGKRLKFDDSEKAAIPEWFQSLTYKCMAQNPHERPSFGELKDHHFA
ncbi:TKL protein kinase [Salpingoeca rosetta]|uniref:TKL protein kinase n=1 Tax=Salpingoeca rosetta (strain ATCC 50818 / BSB-021) TaxID=946362 RepID=F2U741_SALR5|nr:TKL protein kinase [Salpingoeca rosetta]EGD83673.1 TKL protein kinase [Salpingoeca rosetta]|eukprot:XP_004995177.1 TKL protein kinase [Salpingoeca rosetta]